MAAQLVIRAYDVGLGDCVYCRVPGALKVGRKQDDLHILIDCGSWSGMPFLKAALDRLAETLPDAGNGKKRLDLVIATHEHKDHIAGFDPELFGRFKIGHIWLSAAMNPNHPQATKARSLNAAAAVAMRRLAVSGSSLSPEIQEFAALFGIDNSGAMNALRKTLPEANGIDPRYVHAGMTNDQLGLTLKDARITVLGPEQDIDGFYLGKEADEALRAMVGFSATPGVAPTLQTAVAPNLGPFDAPMNIGIAEFKRLRSRMLSSALAFAALSSKATNNSSVVILIEWSGKRLLFVGDAEWHGAFREKKANGSWNVMWNQRREQLGRPIDFLKIGHHGSINATPWAEGSHGPHSEPAQILDAILPLPVPPRRPRAQAIVSTERGKYETIPDAELMVELGRRIATTREYHRALTDRGIDPTSVPKFGGFEKKWIKEPQPLRTDFERMIDDCGFVELKIGKS